MQDPFGTAVFHGSVTAGNIGSTPLIYRIKGVWRNNSIVPGTIIIKIAWPYIDSARVKFFDNTFRRLMHVC